ncbi:FkbM family methyltransferase [Phormidium sp. LEGE 05292]|uniref:FkbM family methyltransferase n=1 Tax=[Phormidium] sp. LEGE 05292 TaxID=767427 RepID=UPI0018813961|nr:FkbM family methyltransferase [Phormidium sp. LEGE 05292]MBE9224280.1 FkbM family methyltransferase [Phormidium sp. LEGE 05292]
MDKQSYSQFGEDLEILKFFNFKKLAYYVEIGANDGITNSNTFLLEQQGWKGLLVEANPDLIPCCLQSRPNSIVMNYAVVASEKIGTIDFYRVVGGPRGLDGLSTTVTDGNFISMINQYGGKVEKISVPATILDDILNQNNSPVGFELLSIDVEGAELEVLKGFSIEHFKPRIILVEDNSQGKDVCVRNYLKLHGYVRVHRTGVNDWYVNYQDAVFFSFKRIILVLRLVKWWFMREILHRIKY